MKKSYIFSACLVLTCLIISVETGFSATIVSAASGSWNAGTTWVGGVPPSSSDEAVISAGHTVTVTATATVQKITVNAGATLICNATLGLQTTTSLIHGTVDITVANGLKRASVAYDPTISVDATGIIKFGTSGTSNVRYWTLNTGSTVIYYGAVQALNQYMATYSNLTLSGSALKTLSLNTTINHKLSLQGTTYFDLGGYYLFYGPLSTIEYKGDALQVIGSEFPANFTGEGGIIIDNPNSVYLIGSRSIDEGLHIVSGPLVIAPTGRLTVDDNVQLTGPECLVLQSGGSGTASLITNGEILYSGGATVNCQRFLASEQWHYLCIPFQSINAWTFFDLYMKYYSEPEHHFRYVIAGAADSTLQSNGLGYAMWFGSDVTVSMISNNLNTGNISIPVTRSWDGATSDFDGWNLIGNPYPSAIDLTMVLFNNLEETAWFWDPAASNYMVYPSGGGGSHTEICPQEQAFFVHCNDPSATQTTPGTGSLDLTNEARVHSSEPFLKNSSDPLNLLRLKVAGTVNSFYDEMSVYFNDSRTASYEPGFDAEKIEGSSNAPQVWSVIPDYNLSVNALRFDQADMVIPVSFRDNIADSYTLTASGFESFSPDITIQLEDLKEGTITDLRSEPVYTFDHVMADDPGRFLLHFGDPNLGENNPEQACNLPEIYSYNDKIYVRYSGTGQLSGTISVCDIIGRSLFTGNLENKSLQEFALPGYNGYYIVKLTTPQGATCQKVLL